MNTVNFVTIPSSIVPEQEILVFGARRLTYADLNDQVARLCAVSLARNDKRQHREQGAWQPSRNSTSIPAQSGDQDRIVEFHRGEFVWPHQ